MKSGEETQVKVPKIMFNKIIQENSPNIKEGVNYQGTKSMQNITLYGTKHKFTRTHNN